jgi:hypothetical protein
MKIRTIAPVAMAAVAAAIGFAPIAAAAPTATTNTGAATVVQSPGNAQVTTAPGVASQQPSCRSRFSGTGMGACCSTTAAIAEPLFKVRPGREGCVFPCAGRTFSCGGFAAVERR